MMEWGLKDKILNASVCFLPLSHSDSVSHNKKLSVTVQHIRRQYGIYSQVLLISSNRFLPLINAEKIINAEKEGSSGVSGGRDLERQCFRTVRVVAAFRVGGRRVELGRQTRTGSEVNYQDLNNGM